MTRKDLKPTSFDIELQNPAEPQTTIIRTVQRYFRRFVQFSPADGRKIYFKEFGDPRKIDPKNGNVDPLISDEEQATEILYLALYTPGQTYGLPRWIGQLPSVLGSRESENVNLNFFRENAIPAMAVLVSGGALTADSFEVIENYINSVKGSKAMNRIMVLEASADDTTGSTDHALSAPKIDMKPMISERQQEGLFQDYDQKNQAKVRSSFRLPPIYTGRAEDYTRASAFASMLTAENQIFVPERVAFDDIMNNRILRSYKPKYWRFKTLGPALSEPDSLSKMLKAFDDTGALTPNAVIKIANKMLDVQIEPIMEDWGDYPMPVILGYIQQGREIKGLDSFLKPLPKPVAPAAGTGSPIGKPKAPGAAAKPVKPLPTKAAKAVTSETINRAQVRAIVRKEVEAIQNDLREAVEDMQTFARAA